MKINTIPASQWVPKSYQTLGLHSSRDTHLRAGHETNTSRGELFWNRLHRRKTLNLSCLLRRAKTAQVRQWHGLLHSLLWIIENRSIIWTYFDEWNVCSEEWIDVAAVFLWYCHHFISLKCPLMVGPSLSYHQFGPWPNKACAVLLPWPELGLWRW